MFLTTGISTDDMFPHTDGILDIFPHTGDIHTAVSGHVETVVLLCRKHIIIEMKAVKNLPDTCRMPILPP